MYHGLVRGQFVGMSQAVCLFLGSTSFAWRADCEDVSGGALVSAPLRGAARGCITGSFAASLWGCLRRFACFGAQRRDVEEGGGVGMRRNEEGAQIQSYSKLGVHSYSSELSPTWARSYSQTHTQTLTMADHKYEMHIWGAPRSE